MNTNSNTYTVIYSVVLVVLVAAILSFVAISLQPKQNENIKIETVSKVFTAAAQSCGLEVEAEGAVLAQYSEAIAEAFYVDGNGAVVGSMNTGKEDLSAIEVPSTSDLKRQNDLIKKIDAGAAELVSELRLPVFIFDIEGSQVTVIPCYGAGLWGPIWGYLAIEADGKTIAGAVFDHKSETPGLGAKIAEEPFYSKFKGKVIGAGDEKFAVKKGESGPSCVDAISGASITSAALGVSVNNWLKIYEPYLAGVQEEEEEGCCCCCGGCAEEACGECETVNNEEE